MGVRGTQALAVRVPSFLKGPLLGGVYNGSRLVFCLSLSLELSVSGPQVISSQNLAIGEEHRAPRMQEQLHFTTKETDSPISPVLPCFLGRSFTPTYWVSQPPGTTAEALWVVPGSPTLSA